MPGEKIDEECLHKNRKKVSVMLTICSMKTKGEGESSLP